MSDARDDATPPARDAPAGAGGPDGARRARTSSGDPIGPGVARDLSELARELQAEPDEGAVRQRIVDAAVAEIPAATAAAITLVAKGTVTTAAHSNDLAARVGAIQARTGQGPCVDTSRREVTLRSGDLRTEPRWPGFSAEAAACGVLSVISVQLFVEHDSMGALDVYSDTVDAFDDDAENVGLLLAAHAAIAMSSSRKVTNLHVAITSRDLIGQAKGILMERYKINADQAFDLLIMSSQHANLKLRDVAERLTTAGELVDRCPRSPTATRAVSTNRRARPPPGHAALTIR